MSIILPIVLIPIIVIYVVIFAICRMASKEEDSE